MDPTKSLVQHSRSHLRAPIARFHLPHMLPVLQYAPAREQPMRMLISEKVSPHVSLSRPTLRIGHEDLAFRPGMRCQEAPLHHLLLGSGERLLERSPHRTGYSLRPLGPAPGLMRSGLSQRAPRIQIAARSPGWLRDATLPGHHASCAAPCRTPLDPPREESRNKRTRYGIPEFPVAQRLPEQVPTDLEGGGSLMRLP